jgi:radical SAM protein with 4Fe4S-binding SPASM domain
LRELSRRILANARGGVDAFIIKQGDLMEILALRMVFWETTNACNLSCVHCRRLDVGGVNPKQDMNAEEARRLIESLAKDFNPPPVLVLSGGEPLARPDIFELAHLATAKGIQTALATNGTMMTPVTAQAIAESGIRRVSVSLDGALESTHDNFRQVKGSFKKALNGISFLKSAGIPVQLNVTLTRHNIDELDSIYKMAIELGVESLHYFLLVPVGCGLEIEETYQLQGVEYESALIKIHQQAREGKIHIRPICAPHYFRIMVQQKSSLLQMKQKMNSMERLSRGCLAGTSICFVSHSGDVFPCGYFPLSQGNVKETSLREIWGSSDTFQKLRNVDSLEGKCGLCEFKQVCFGCRARAFAETGNFLAEEPRCSYQPK